MGKIKTERKPAHNKNKKRNGKQYTTPFAGHTSLNNIKTNNKKYRIQWEQHYGSNEMEGRNQEGPCWGEVVHKLKAHEQRSVTRVTSSTTTFEKHQEGGASYASSPIPSQQQPIKTHQKQTTLSSSSITTPTSTTIHQRLKQTTEQEIGMGESTPLHPPFMERMMQDMEYESPRHLVATTTVGGNVANDTSPNDCDPSREETTASLHAKRYAENAANSLLSSEEKMHPEAASFYAHYVEAKQLAKTDAPAAIHLLESFMTLPLGSGTDCLSLPLDTLVTRQEICMSHQYVEGDAITAINFVDAYYFKLALLLASIYAKVQRFRQSASLYDALVIRYCSSIAMNNLGSYYRDGRGVSRRSYRAACRLFRAGARLGNAAALGNLGYMYSKGLGIAMDPHRALQLYEAASSLGNAQASVNCAEFYASGRAMAYPSRHKALSFYQLACHQGYAGAPLDARIAHVIHEIVLHETCFPCL